MCPGDRVEIAAELAGHFERCAYWPRSVRYLGLAATNAKLITQRQAAEEIGVTERQVRRLLRKLRRRGDRAVIHELHGRASNRKLPTELEQQAMAILSD